MYYPIVGYSPNNAFPCEPILLTFFEDDDPADISGFNATFALGDNAIVDEAVEITGGPGPNTTYSGGGIAANGSSAWSIVCYFYYATGGPFTADLRIWAMQGFSSDLRLFIHTATALAGNRKLYCRTGVLFDATPDSDVAFPNQTWQYIAVQCENTTPALDVYIGSQRVIHDTTNIGGQLPTSSGVLTISDQLSSGFVKITDARVFPCIIYPGSPLTITPPARVGGG